jgi:hypothetical protein
MTTCALGRRQLVPRLRELLRVDDVWCDTGSAESAAEFVAWAGRTLTSTAEFRQHLGSRTFSFSLLVHTDASAPSIDFMVQSSVLQVGRKLFANGLKPGT